MEILSKQAKYEGRFLVFRTIDWVDAYGVKREWETADRVADQGAVLIIPRLVPSNRYALIRQFRPPVGRMSIEFPAGLMDKGETATAAAARELREETGFIASRLDIAPPAYTTPGMSNESVHMVKAEIDETAEENQNPKTDFDPSESIETILIKKEDLITFYRQETERGTSFDAKLAAFILATTL